VFGITVLPDGNLATASEDKSIKIWNMKNNECLKTLNGHTDLVFGTVILDNGLLVSASRDKTIRIWQ
jgi:WD40 repeat protein